MFRDSLEGKLLNAMINEHKLPLVSVYKEDENKVIHIITNNLDWTAGTIADLYKKDEISSFFLCKRTYYPKLYIKPSKQ
jgi:hypothetical protein